MRSDVPACSRELARGPRPLGMLMDSPPREARRDALPNHPPSRSSVSAPQPSVHSLERDAPAEKDERDVMSALNHAPGWSR